ncbi:MAG: NOP5/NOP56 family protein [Candidatus Micrarchaeaceae archaeon]
MKETAEQKRRRLIELAKESVAQAYSTGEHAIMQAVNTYNELEKAKNLVHERLTEWYGIYFPELRISQHAYASLVAAIGTNKRNADYEALAKASGIDVGELRALAARSIGKEPEEKEYEVIKRLAESELELESVQNGIDAYLRSAVEKLMPNIASLIDYRLAAELLSKAGSLNKLANMPASTIQLLGAEKALFRHLKYGAKPPKYGVLFKLKEVTNAQKKEKGRIARLYATKISIAARADAISKHFIGKELKQSLDEAMQRLKSKTASSGK